MPNCTERRTIMKQRIIMAVLLAAVTAGGVDGACAHGAGGHGSGMEEEGWGPEGGMSPERGLGRMAEGLGLSDAQRAKIKAIFTAERDKNAPLREKLAEYGKQLRQAEQAAQFDEAAVRAIAANRAQVEIELTVSRGRLHSQINALLTPEQRALAEQLRPFMDGRGPERCRPAKGERGARHQPSPPF
jgi:Spy/CpxP family protein refolding chaperone